MSSESGMNLHKWESKFKDLQHDVPFGYYRNRHGKFIKITDLKTNSSLFFHCCKQLHLSREEMRALARQIESYPITAGLSNSMLNDQLVHDAMTTIVIGPMRRGMPTLFSAPTFTYPRRRVRK